MLDIICTRKEKTRVILFFEIYKMVLIIFKYENCSYTGDPPMIKRNYSQIQCSCTVSGFVPVCSCICPVWCRPSGCWRSTRTGAGIWRSGERRPTSTQQTWNSTSTPTSPWTAPSTAPSTFNFPPTAISTAPKTRWPSKPTSEEFVLISINNQDLLRNNEFLIQIIIIFHYFCIQYQY